MITNGINDANQPNDGKNYRSDFLIDKRVVDEWVGDIFTKVILAAKNENRLLKIIHDAEAIGFAEGVDYFPIRDACLTELIPDKSGTRLTCVGFAPKPKSELAPLLGRLQLYRD